MAIRHGLRNGWQIIATSWTPKLGTAKHEKGRKWAMLEKSQNTRDVDKSHKESSWLDRNAVGES